MILNNRTRVDGNQAPFQETETKFHYPVYLYHFNVRKIWVFGNLYIIFAYIFAHIFAHIFMDYIRSSFLGAVYSVSGEMFLEHFLAFHSL